MITDKEILEFCLVTNKNATTDDVAAFRRFMRCFDCEDAATPQEAQEKVLASMDMITNEIQRMDDLTARAYMRERYSKL